MLDTASVYFLFFQFLVFIECFLISFVFHLVVELLFCSHRLVKSWNWNICLTMSQSAVSFLYLFDLLTVKIIPLSDILLIIDVIGISFLYINRSTRVIFRIIWVFLKDLLKNLSPRGLIPPFILMVIIILHNTLQLSLCRFSRLRWSTKVLGETLLALSYRNHRAIFFFLWCFYWRRAWWPEVKLRLASDVSAHQLLDNIVYVNIFIKPCSLI